MESLLSNIPNIATLLGGAAAGVLTFVGLFDVKMRGRSKSIQREEDNIEDRVRTLYREASSIQEKKIGELSQKVDGLEREVARLTVENKTLRDILQGRDQDSIENQRKGIEAARIATETRDLVLEQQKISLENQNEIRQVNHNIERLASAIERHLDSKN